MATPNLPQLSPAQRLQAVMDNPIVAAQYKAALAEHRDVFVASMVELYASDSALAACDPKLVALEALKAATIRLPVNRSLGFCFILAYKKNGVPVPQFQLGYKGRLQLAMRTGQYKTIHDDVVYEGELQGNIKLTGEIDLSGKKISDTVIGYFSHIETINGFKKTVYCSKEDMKKHVKKYSKGADRESSPWRTDFDSMARKTMLIKLLSKYGIMSVDTAHGSDDFDEGDAGLFRDEANSEIIDMETGEITPVSQQNAPPAGPRNISAMTQEDPGY